MWIRKTHIDSGSFTCELMVLVVYIVITALYMETQEIQILYTKTNAFVFYTLV